MAQTGHTWGTMRSQRLAIVTIGAAVVVLLGGASAYLITRSDSNPPVTRVFGESTAPPPTTQAETSTSSTAGATQSVPGTSTTSMPRVTTTTTRRVMTTTSLVCRNSFDARCGPFRWDPDPGPNQPSSAQITFSPVNPHVGEQVSFRVTFTNPDGPADSGETHMYYGDGMAVWLTSDPPWVWGGDCKTLYGPWTPPRREANSVSFDMGRYPYSAAGTYAVTVTGDLGFGRCDQPNPYRDPKSASTTITVSP